MSAMFPEQKAFRDGSLGAITMSEESYKSLQEYREQARVCAAELSACKSESSKSKGSCSVELQEWRKARVITGLIAAAAGLGIGYFIWRKQ